MAGDCCKQVLPVKASTLSAYPIPTEYCEVPVRSPDDYDQLANREHSTIIAPMLGSSYEVALSAPTHIRGASEYPAERS